MANLVLLDVVGLSPALVGEHTPNIAAYLNENVGGPMSGVFPAVTTTAQSSMVTGQYPQTHGIVGNGWYDRDYAEVVFWKQSNALVQAEKIWEREKRAKNNFRCSKLFWWFNMYARVDASITPRPHYPADGRKVIDLYSTPTGLHQKIEERLGKFPFFNFWGPKAGIQSSQWIANAAKIEFEWHKPNLQLVYLPHLDYCLQKFGPHDDSIAAELRAIDKIVGDLLDFYQAQGTQVILVSEYGIRAVDTPVHINRVLREHGLIQIRESLSWELLDPGASAAFAVADHQVAHVYVNDAHRLQEVKSLLEKTSGIQRVLDGELKKDFHIDHKRAGDLIALAEPQTWFTYYYWLDDLLAPDFARTVDIHRKPGYDPVEMFVDPELALPVAKVAFRLLQKKLGFRMLMDVIPLDAHLVNGSHGLLPDSPDNGAIVILPKALARDNVAMVELPTIVQQFFRGH